MPDSLDSQVGPRFHVSVHPGSGESDPFASSCPMWRRYPWPGHSQAVHYRFVGPVEVGLVELEVGSWEGSPSPNGSLPGLGYDELSAVATESALLLGLLLEKDSSEEKVPLSSYGGVAQLVERLTGSQEVRGFESLRLHRKPQVRALLVWGLSRPGLKGKQLCKQRRRTRARRTRADGGEQR